MNAGKIKIWSILLISTVVLIFGIIFSIVMSSSYLSPLGSNYAKKELETLDKLLLSDYSILTKIFSDLTITNEEKLELDRLGLLKYNIGKIKFIIQERDRRTIYSKGSIIINKEKYNSYFISVGKISIDFVAFFKKILFYNINNDCNKYFRNPYVSYQDKIEVYEVGCAFNLNKSMMRIYKGDRYNTSYIISKSIPIAIDNKVVGVIYIASDAKDLEEELGIILISILSPVLFSILLVSIFIFYLQNFLSTKVRSNWINAKNIAHNLKNKTNAIKFYTSKDFDNIKNYKNNIKKINTIIDNLDNFIETTLTTAKYEHYGIAFNKKLNKVDVNEVISLIQDLYVSKNIRIDNKINITDNISYTINAEKNKLIEAISAVIDNSLHWNLANANVEVSIHENKEFIDLMVMDRGPGINDKDKKNVFTKNYSKSGGTGIGLYIAKTILASYGGDLYAIDREGGGLIMVFKLKISKK